MADVSPLLYRHGQSTGVKHWCFALQYLGLLRHLKDDLAARMTTLAEFLRPPRLRKW